MAGDGAGGRGEPAHPPRQRRATAGQRDRRARRGARRRAPRRPRAGDTALRRQPQQHFDRARRAGAADRLRPGSGPQRTRRTPGVRCRRGPDVVGARGSRHPRVHGARAPARRRPRSAQRHLLSGPGAVRDVRRHAGVRGQEHGRVGRRRDGRRDRAIGKARTRCAAGAGARRRQGDGDPAPAALPDRNRDGRRPARTAPLPRVGRRDRGGGSGARPQAHELRPARRCPGGGRGGRRRAAVVAVGRAAGAAVAPADQRPGVGSTAGALSGRAADRVRLEPDGQRRHLDRRRRDRRGAPADRRSGRRHRSRLVPGRLT